MNSHELSTAYVLNGMAGVQMSKTAGARTFGEMGGTYFDGITAPQVESYDYFGKDSM